MGWFILRVHALHEDAVAVKLERHGIATWFPKRIIWKNLRRAAALRAGSSRERRLKPLLHGYLFVSINFSYQFEILKELKYIFGLVSFGNLPAEILNDDMTKFMVREIGHEFDETLGQSAAPLDPAAHARSLVGETFVISADNVWQGHALKVVEASKTALLVQVDGQMRKTVKIPLCKFVELIYRPIPDDQGLPRA